MTISSSKGIVKPGGVTAVQDFVLPVQTLASLPKDMTEPLKKPREHKRTDYSLTADHEEALYQESGRIINGAKEESNRILARAHQMMEELLEEARRQAEKIKASAAEEGYQEGYDRGLKEATEKVVSEHETFRKVQEEQFRSEMTEALSSVQEAKSRSLAKYLDELRDCSVAVAEKVIHISLKSSGEVIKRMIIAETEKLKKMAWVKIYMDKADYEAMIEADADVLNELSRLSDNIKFIVMEKDARGNCIIEMPEEIVDISVDTQMDNIKEILGSVHV